MSFLGGKIPEIWFGCWNVRSTKENEEDGVKLRGILVELERNGVKIAALTETRTPRRLWGAVVRVDDWTIYHAADQAKGTAWAVHKDVAGLVVDWAPVSRRICRLDLRCKRGRPMRLLAVYAPTATDEGREAQTEGFYRELKRQVRDHARYAILGDFNARLPVGVTAYTGPHGREANQKPNDNTDDFQEFLLTTGSMSAASYFKKGHRGYATWSFGWYGKRKQRGKRATKIPKRPSAAQRTRYNGRVQELHASGVELQESLRRAAADTFFREREEKPWISEEFREIWRERRAEHEKGNSEEAKALLKLLKWIERRDREAYAEAACEEAEETFERTGLAPALTKISRLAGKRKRHATGAAGRR
eukprot:g12962.t1